MWVRVVGYALMTCSIGTSAYAIHVFNKYLELEKKKLLAKTVLECVTSVNDVMRVAVRYMEGRTRFMEMQCGMQRPLDKQYLNT
jgi:hypothetical protein